jgi:hypothetical protein
MKAKVGKDQQGKARIAEPITLGTGAVVAALTAWQRKDYASAISIALVALVPYVSSLLADAQR